MDKYKKYYGVMIFAAALFALFLAVYLILGPRIAETSNLKSNIENQENQLSSLKSKITIVQNKIKKIKNSIVSSQKKIYSPIESDLGNDTLFFTLYNDVIEMLHSNSIKIKTIEYTYNPETDSFVKFGKDVYFVCDVEMEVVSNYVNLGKFIQDVYQYPYYIKINNIEVKPYAKDKKVLISNISLRLYAHTSPEQTEDIPTEPINGATSPLPQ